MKRDSDNNIIPKIIVLLGTLSVVGIIVLFFFPKEIPSARIRPKSEVPTKLFAQVIESALPKILKLWREGDQFLVSENLSCDDEIIFSKKVGRSYYQCQPHFWQCYWQGGVTKDPVVEVDLFGRKYHVVASADFDVIPEFSKNDRFYKTVKIPEFGYGHLARLKVQEIPNVVQDLFLKDSCQGAPLPQRIYGYANGKNLKSKDEGFIWDNFNRNILIDRHYVSNQKLNEWYVLKNENEKIIKDKNLWPMPALLNLEEQRKYCNFFGKKLLEAKLFDAATMTPSDIKNPKPGFVFRPATPWQRDISRTFLGLSRINQDYQLTPLDCQLAQVGGCPEKIFNTDSSSWIGINYGLGYYPESLENNIEPNKNLKASSRFVTASSPIHELGVRTSWNGMQDQKSGTPVAFRCYKEIWP